jgi:hypothetical protein
MTLILMARGRGLRGIGQQSLLYDGPAELPRPAAIDPLLAFNTTTFFAGYTPRINHTPTTASELNTLLTGGTLNGQTLQRGDWITLTAGTAYTSTTRRAHTFPVLSGTFTWDDPATWVWVRTANVNSLPAVGTRVASSDANAVTRLADCPLFDVFQNAGGVYPLTVANGASGYCLTGLGGRRQEGNWTAGNSYWLALGVASGQTTLADLPDGCVVDRCIFLGDPRDWTSAVPATPFGLAINTKRFIVRDSWIDAGASRGNAGVEGGGTENQAISISQSIGPGLMDNNTLIASGENMMTGGSDPNGAILQASGVNPTDVIFSRNYCPSRPKWNIRSAESDGFGVQCKNNFELKKGVRWLIEGNVFEYWFAPDQAKPVNIKRTNQSGNDLESRCEDITFRYNLVTESPSFINFSNENTANNSINRVSVHDNVVPMDQRDEFTNAATTGYVVQIGALDWSFKNNSLLRLATGSAGCLGTLLLGTTFSSGTNAVLTDNVLPNVGSYIVRYDGVGGSATGWNTAKTRYTTNSGSNNLQIGGTSSTGLGTAFGAVAADNAAAFVDAANGNYTITDTFDNESSTGGAPGADLTTLASKTAGAISGSW